MENNLINSSLLKGVSYSTYRSLVKKLLAEKKSTGKEQSENLLNYSSLNDKRMDRLDKKLKLSENFESFIDQLKCSFTFLIISEGWCGDAAQILPMINKVVESSSKLDMKIVLRDENEELMNQFLTNGSKSIPKLLVLDKNNELINTWGPRPSIATKMVVDYKNEHGSLDADFKKDLQIWYNKNKGENIQNDLLKLMENCEVEVG